MTYQTHKVILCEQSFLYYIKNVANKVITVPRYNAVYFLQSCCFTDFDEICML